jgi:hypothetical protein
VSRSDECDYWVCTGDLSSLLVNPGREDDDEDDNEDDDDDTIDDMPEML